MACAFSHESIALSERTASFLEHSFAALFGDSTSATGTGKPDSDAAQTIVQGGIPELLAPWARAVRRAAAGSKHIIERISHEALEFVSQLLSDSGLDRLMEAQENELARANPRLLAEFAGLPLESRAKLLADYGETAEKTRQRVGRALRRVCMRSLPGFLTRLAQTARDYKRGEDSIKAAFGVSPAGWDLEQGQWMEDALLGMDQAASALARNADFAKLLDSLGRRAVARQKPADALSNRQAEAYAKIGELALGRQELVGTDFGSNPETIMPGSYALLAHGQGRQLFFADFAEQRLASYDFKTRLKPDNRNQQEKKTPHPEQNLGPFILCVDTSGSMAGVPELCAKAVGLAAFRRALETGRRLGLVMFSAKAHSQLFLPPAKPQAFLAFLAHAFRGGTDLRPALDETIRLVWEPGMENSDVLIISDFRVPKIMVKKSAKLIELQEARGCRVHAISIGGHPILDDYNLFETRWLCRAQIPAPGAGVDASIHETD